MNIEKKKTYFIDIDGTIVPHMTDASHLKYSWSAGTSLPNVLHRMSKMWAEGHTIILVTARGEGLRSITIEQLFRAGIQFHHLLMNLPSGQRILINDTKPGCSEETAIGITVPRNQGWGDVIIP